jgi:hypothetical protein
MRAALLAVLLATSASHLHIADVVREATSVVRVLGDLRGQTITAMANVYHLGDELYADVTEIS